MEQDVSRNYSPLDHLLMRLDRGLRAAAPPAPGEAAQAPDPAADAADSPLPDADRRHAAGLMRVNHAGEIAAQALYRGQAMTARSSEVREHLLAAASEEQAHLQWCERRLAELGEAPSRLDPLWYAGSFAIGALAGALGDRLSLGFVEETEKQVSEHLEGHLEKLPEGDARSRAIVAAMRRDEERHGREAAARGASALPQPVREAMRAVARVMTKTAYWI